MKPPFPTVQFEKLPEQVFNLHLFREIIQNIKQTDKPLKIEETKRLFSLDGLHRHYTDKITKRIVLASCKKLEYPHERHTSQKLTGIDYDVIFVPNGYFKRSEKKFDVFLSPHMYFWKPILNALPPPIPIPSVTELKKEVNNHQELYWMLRRRSRNGDLIEGLKTGCERNDGLKEILLFYNSAFYRLPTTQILSKRIFEVIK